MSKILRRSFLEISRGYTTLDFGGKTLYVKHLSHADHVELEDIQDRFEKKARDSGAPTEKQQLEFLKKEGLWSEQDEKNIFDRKDYVRGLERGKKTMKYPSMLQKIDEDIQKENKLIFELEKKKIALVGLTVESYAAKLINDYYVIKSIFIDTDFKKPYLSVELFDDLDDIELQKLFDAYSSVMETCNDRNLKKLTMQDFYKSYYYLCEDDFFKFFGTPISKMTYFQVKLANYSKYYTQLMQKVKIENIPEHIRDDPDKLAEYIEAIDKGKKMINDKDSKGAVGMVGATAADIKAITGQEPTKAPTKPMNMQEMMKMHNR